MLPLRSRVFWAAGNIERMLMVASYMYFCLIILAEVILRYVFSYSTPWGEMSARYAFILLVYVAMSDVARGRNHIRINIVPARLGAGGRFGLYLYFDVLQLVLVSLVVFYSLQTMREQIANQTLMTGADVNMAFAQAVLPLGWSLLAFRVVQRALRMTREYRSTGQVQLGESGLNE